MKKLIIASKNKGKINEFKEILNDFNVVSMYDENINIDIEETGSTFEENAIIKANAIYELTNECSVADDSGLEIDYLNGKPGVYSARFVSREATDEDRNNKILELLKGVPKEKRTARFVCVIAVKYSEDIFFTSKGICEGIIGEKAVGENGFGYDPLFYIPEFNMTTAQMSSYEKNKISHRGKALHLMVENFKKYIYNLHKKD